MKVMMKRNLCHLLRYFVAIYLIGLLNHHTHLDLVQSYNFIQKPVIRSHYKLFVSSPTASLTNDPTISNNAKLVTKDGEIMKELIKKSTLPAAASRIIEAGDILAIEYTAKIKGAEQPFAQGSKTKFVFKDGTMIKGWDLAVGSMKIGERARFVIGPRYGYGEQGIPGVIPPNTELEFEIAVLGWLGNQMRPETLFKSDLELDPFLATTPEQIQAEYNKKLQEKKDDDRYKGNIFQIYLRRIQNTSIGFAGSSFFRSTTGDAAPWYLNPLITFPSMALILIVAFGAVFGLGGIREKGIVPSDLDVPTSTVMQSGSSASYSVPPNSLSE